MVSYVRNSFGNHSTLVTPADVARVRAQIKDQTQPWTLEQLNAMAPIALTNRGKWILTGSTNPSKLHFAVDGDRTTSYDSDAAQTSGMWLEAELPESHEICGVQLDCGAAYTNYPMAYKVQLSQDGTAWSDSVAEGHSPSSLNLILFPPKNARFIRITQTGQDPVKHWSVNELDLLRKPTAAEMLAAKTALEASRKASSNVNPYDGEDATQNVSKKTGSGPKTN